MKYANPNRSEVQKKCVLRIKDILQHRKPFQHFLFNVYFILLEVLLIQNFTGVYQAHSEGLPPETDWFPHSQLTK